MYTWLGRLIPRTWLLWLAVWALLFAGTWMTAPPWRATARDGEFNFMPPDVMSRRGEELLRRAFPNRRDQSSAVILLSREGQGDKLTDADRQFISHKLRPGLEKIRQEERGSESGRSSRSSPAANFIAQILSLDDKDIGPLLVSEDQRATLVVVELTADFMVRRAIPTLKKIDDLLAQLRRQGSIPSGLSVDLTGSAEIGRDMMEAESQSARTIQAWTVWLVIILLLLFYRAPLVAIIPLVTLSVAVSVAIRALLLLAQAGYVGVFRGLDVYVTVVAYAVGVDYNLFLISRYEEEAAERADLREALARALGRIGGALTASAATVICGIGTLTIAEFGKFRQAGVGIAFSLFVMLCATMTLTPALLRLSGRWAFWPWGIQTRAERASDVRSGWLRWVSGYSSAFQRLWEGVGNSIRKRPGTIWVLTVLILSPFAGYAAANYNNLNYGLIQGLPKRSPSVVGTRALTRHYPVGDSGPLTLVIRNDRVDFSTQAGIDLIRELAGRLERRRGDLKIADLRSVAQPLGIRAAAREVTATASPLSAPFTALVAIGRAVEHYVSNTTDLDHHVTKLSVTLDIDPYTRESIRHLDYLEREIHRALPGPLAEGSELYFTGATASFRDLKLVADRDREWINSMVTVSVLIVLIVLLRRVAIPVYLILSVVFGYLVTLGVTFAYFRLAEGANFPGLDWTVPLFLFTLLIAIGEDYNIILVTRIDEEQDRHGPVPGVIHALAKTGAVISGCGFIMAGTFSSLMFGGSLARMYQLGFALTFGVLLDTFVVRPVLVPAYLILVNDGRFGQLARYLGGRPESVATRHEPVESIGAGATTIAHSDQPFAAGSETRSR